MINSISLCSYNAKVYCFEAHYNSDHVELLFMCNSQYTKSASDPSSDEFYPKPPTFSPSPPCDQDYTSARQQARVRIYLSGHSSGLTNTAESTN